MTDEQKIARYLVEGEEIWSVSKQRQILGVWPFWPNCVVLTSRRFFILKPSLTGTKFEDMVWLDIDNIHVSEEMLTATLSCKGTNGSVISCDGLEKESALALYRMGQHGEEQMREARRQRYMEENRSGAVHLQYK